MIEMPKPRLLGEHKLELSILLVFIAMFAAFLIGNPAVFSRYDIYYSFMSTIPFFGIMALSMTLVVTLGEMDLSFPSVLAFAAWVMGRVLEVTHHIWLAVLACLIIGALAGIIKYFWPKKEQEPLRYSDVNIPLW